MSFLERVQTNLEDIRLFGPGILARHLGRLRKDRIVRLPVKGKTIHVRAGESDIAAIRQVFGKRDYDVSGLRISAGRIQKRYEDILAQGGTPVIIDAGANIGSATLWFKQQYPDAAVVAIEPDPGNLEILRLNCTGLSNVHIMPAAIGSEPGFVSLVSEGLGWAVQTERATAGIPIVTVDNALAQVEGGVPFMTKIDIEGFERDLFARNVDWIDGMAAIIIEPHDWMMQGEYTSASFQRAIGAYGFEMFYRGENIFYIR